MEIQHTTGVKVDYFFGEYRVSLDEKGRMRVPNKLRDKVVGDYVIYAGNNDCLYLVTKATFEAQYAEAMINCKLGDFAAQEAWRQLSTAVQEPEEDSQGRFILQSNLKILAKIKKKMVFLGVGNRIEIWSEEVYDARYSIDKIDMNAVITALRV